MRLRVVSPENDYSPSCGTQPLEGKGTVMDQGKRNHIRM
jgi:hypothetical protein